MITITATNVSDINKTSTILSRSLRKHIASRQTKSGVVLFSNAMIIMSIYFTATIFIILLAVDYIDLRIIGKISFFSISV